MSDEVSDARSKAHLLQPRQEYVLDEEIAENRSGRLRVRLPVRYEPEFLQRRLPTTRTFKSGGEIRERLRS